jgi:uncharacterized Zn-binding protein involved in type VI secretion
MHVWSNGSGPITNGSPDVLIGKMPAATAGDIIIQGSSSVFINKKTAARIGDGTTYGGTVTSGFSTVLVGD